MSPDELKQQLNEVISKLESLRSEEVKEYIRHKMGKFKISEETKGILLVQFV